MTTACLACGCPCWNCHGRGGSFVVTLGSDGRTISPMTPIPCPGCGDTPIASGVTITTRSPK